MTNRRRSTTDVTDPGRPPDEALDAALRALGDPVAPETRETAESAGLDAARYHGEPHSPPARAAIIIPEHHHPSRDTEPMGGSTREVEVDLEAAGPDTILNDARRRDATTAVRGPSKASTFAVAFVFVVILLGVGAWAFTREPGVATTKPAVVSSSSLVSPTSATSIGSAHAGATIQVSPSTSTGLEAITTPNNSARVEATAPVKSASLAPAFPHVTAATATSPPATVASTTTPPHVTPTRATGTTPTAAASTPTRTDLSPIQ